MKKNKYNFQVKNKHIDTLLHLDCQDPLFLFLQMSLFTLVNFCKVIVNVILQLVSLNKVIVFC
jgi:hypothetical protein